LPFFLALGVAIFICPLGQAQPGLGGSNLFTNSGMIDSGTGPNSNPYNTLNQLAAPRLPIGKAGPAENTDMDWQPAYLQPFPVAYLNIPELRAAVREILSQTYFVAINGPAAKTFAQLYKDNRLENVSSFVTADSIAHPLLSFQNTVRLAVLDKSLTPLLKSLLVSMLESGRQDYLEAEDTEVKEEIKYNLAFLVVAIRLLQPDYAMPDYPGVKQLVESELNSIKQRRSAYSVIFHRPENFAMLEPIGWHRATPAAQRFFSCCQWLGTMCLELNDSQGSNGNEFRRAFLLFQSLMRAHTIAANNTDQENTGYAVWQKINEILSLLDLNQPGEDNEKSSFQRVLPSNFAGIFPSAKSVSRITLASLSDPLNRTRLFLTLRSNAPRQHLNTTSIFSLSKKKMGNEKQLKFCLINPVYQFNTETCFQTPIFQKDAAAGFSLTPVALVLAQNKGISWAKRVLADNAAKLNDQLTSTASSSKIVGGHFWDTFKSLSSAYSDPAPQVFQTKPWRTFCLERQAAAWVDNMLSCSIGGAAAVSQDSTGEKNTLDTIAANAATQNGATVSNGTLNSTIRKFGIASWRTSGSFNYLEPAAVLYEKMAASETNFEHTLSQSNLFPAQYLERSHDFIRLLKRLGAIANLELNNQAVSADDQALLAGIDKVLQTIEPPLLGNLYIPFGDSSNDADLAAAVIADEHGSVDKDSEEKPARPATKVDDSAVIKLSDSVNQSKPANRFQSPASGDNKGVTLTGVNMGLGYPTCLYVILPYKHVYYLLRGAAYSYHEQCGAPINGKHWQRQLELGFFMEPPFWCASFQRTSQ